LHLPPQSSDVSDVSSRKRDQKSVASDLAGDFEKKVTLVPTPRSGTSIKARPNLAIKSHAIETKPLKIGFYGSGTK
jgi:hypothetical protein